MDDDRPLELLSEATCRVNEIFDRDGIVEVDDQVIGGTRDSERGRAESIRAQCPNPGQASAWLQARRAASAVHDVRKTLTTTNGGTHVKDSLDRIESRQVDQGAAIDELAGRVETLERATQRRRGRLRW